MLITVCNFGKYSKAEVNRGVFVVRFLGFDEENLLLENELFGSFEDNINESNPNIINDLVYPQLKDEKDLPWSDIMRQLELPVSGNEEDDFNNIMDEIRNKIENVSSKYDLNYYEWLMDHTYRVFMSLDETHEEYKESDFFYDTDISEFEKNLF